MPAIVSVGSGISVSRSSRPAGPLARAPADRRADQIHSEVALDHVIVSFAEGVVDVDEHLPIVC
jgi:hypothetical protein